MPDVVSNVAQSQRDASSSPTVRSVPGPRNLTASKRCVVEGVGPLVQPGGVVLPRDDRVVGVEPHRGRDGLPEALEIRLAQHRLRPALVRRRDDHPVDEAFRDKREVELAEVPWLRLADERGVEAVEQGGLGIPGQLDDRRARLPPGLHPVQEVRWRLAELVLGAELDRRLANMQIGRERVDATRPCAERRAGDRTCDRHVLDLVEEHHLLARLHVRADPDDELGKPIEAFLRVHAGDPTGSTRFESTTDRA